MKKHSVRILTTSYDREAKEDNPPFYKKGDTFALLEGVYINELETVSFPSTNDTGKLFNKINSSKNEN